MIRRALGLFLPPALGIVALQGGGAVQGRVFDDRLPAAGAVVFLEGEAHGGSGPSERAAVVDQVDLRFVPRVVAVVPGTIVAFPNSDPILHNVFSPPAPGPGFDLGTYPPGESRSRRFVETGVHVILCNVHPEMVAYVAVVPTPYYAIADSAGEFVIRDVPPGRYRLVVWYGRRASAERDLVVNPEGARGLELELGP